MFFFGSDFYGRTYNPTTLLINENTYKLLEFVWSNRNHITPQAVFALADFASLVSNYPKLSDLLKAEVYDLVNTAKEFSEKLKNSKYVLKNNKIGYEEADSLNFNMQVGYLTTFTYFYEFSRGNIQKTDLQKNVGIFIQCGNYSYAEIPKEFDLIMGVSGTLKSLMPIERKIIENYGIERLAYLPSIYGEPDRQFASVADVDAIVSKNDWFLRIANSAKQHAEQNKRAVLIFFENSTTLDEFYASQSKEMKNVKLFTEKTEYKDNVTKQATLSGNITLCTRPFGRGVDFICHDEITKKKWRSFSYYHFCSIF